MCVARTLFFSAGMLRRTKYSRLHNDSLAPSEDRPQRVSSLKKDLCSDSGFALLDPGTADHHEGSTRHMGKTGPQSGLRGQKPRDQTTRGHADGTDRDWRSGHRLCKPPSSNQPLSGGPSALSGTKRPITLQRMTSLPSKLGCSCSQHTAGLCYPETAAGDLTTVQTANGSVHHNIKVSSPHDSCAQCASAVKLTRRWVCRWPTCTRHRRVPFSTFMTLPLWWSFLCRQQWLILTLCSWLLCARWVSACVKTHWS